VSHPGRGSGDAGGGVVQLPLMATVFVGFTMLIVFIGRVNDSYAAVESAARYSARTLTLARDPATAVDAAEADAAATVDEGSRGCEAMDFAHSIDAEGVSVTVTCIVDLTGLDVFGIPGEWTVTATADEPLDRWRELQ